MTVKTTLSYTDRHHDFLKSKVKQGVFATASAATAIEQLIKDELHRKNALEAISSEIAKKVNGTDV